MKAPGEQTTTPYKPPRQAQPAKPIVRPRVQPRVAKPGLAPARPGVKPVVKPKPIVQKPPVGGGTTPGTQSPPTGSLTGVRSLADLTKIATDQTDSEIAGQVNPLQHEADLSAQREQAAADELNRIFGDLQPGIDQSLQIVANNWDQTRQAQQALFAQASARLNQIKQGAASDAQNLAQQIGGPVAVDKFTNNIDAASVGSEADALRAQESSMGHGNVGVQQLADWTGKVYPLVRTEKQASTRQGYEDQISKLQDQIATIKGQRQGNIDTKLNDLLEKERAYQLQQTDMKLKQKQAAQQWAATQHTLHNDDLRLRIASGQLGVSQLNAATNRSYKQAQVDLKNRKLTQDEINAANKLGLSKQQFKDKMALEWAKQNQNAKYQDARISIGRQKNAMQLAKGLANPTSMKTLTLTHKVPLAKGEIPLASVGQVHGAFRGKDGHWYQLQTEHITTFEWMRRHGFSAGNSDPMSVYKMLTKMGYSPLIAANSVKAATGVDPRQKSSKRGGSK